MALRKGFKYSKTGQQVRKRKATTNQKRAARKRHGKPRSRMSIMKQKKTAKRDRARGRTKSGRRIIKPKRHH